MRSLIGRASRKKGLPPGTMVHVGDKKGEKVQVSVIDYDAGHLSEQEAGWPEECFRFKETPTVTWINVSGVHDTAILEKLGQCFGIHPLVLEDIVHTEQRPKVEDFGDYLFIVMRMVYHNHGDAAEIVSEQISLLVGPNFVISFQESPGDVFDAVRERIRASKGRIRHASTGYLAYALIDAVVDNYFVILERVGGRIEEIEDDLLAHPTPELLRDIHRLKRDMVFLRKAVWPLREGLSTLRRGDSKLIGSDIQVFLADVYDHTIQVMDTIESFRDMISGMVDTYLSSVSNRTNDVMKVLTIIATIFIPLTFVAGIYGMNFEYMPELHWHWAYPAAWGVMGAVTIGMLLFFRRKRWL